MERLGGSENPHSSQTATRYIPEIDGLRAIAVAAVVVFHAFSGFLPGGFTGVDVFFVISGFLIGRILLEGFRDRSFSFIGFYSRRVRRIFPALLVVMSFTLLVGWFFLYATEFMQTGKHIIGAAGFVANIIFELESGYFDSSNLTKPLLHLWSLSVEEQFYLVLPVFLWLVFASRSPGRLLVPVLAILFSGSFLANLYFSVTSPQFAFFSLSTRFWQLLSGVGLAAYLSRRGKTTRDREGVPGLFPWLWDFSFLGGGVLLLLSFLFINESMLFPGFWALIPTGGALMVIAAAGRSRAGRLLLANRPMTQLGRLSYPLYLWHWPLLSFYKIFASEQVDFIGTVIVILASVLLAFLTQRFVELPILRADFANVGKRQILALLSSILVLGALGALVFMSKGMPNRPVNVENAMAIQQLDVSPSLNKECTENYHFPESTSYAYWFCEASSTRPPTILLLGNSFANHLYPGFTSSEVFGRESILSVGACEPAGEKFSADNVDFSFFPCVGTNKTSRQMEFIDDIIRDSPSIKLIIMDGIQLDTSEEYLDRLSARLNFLDQLGIKVVLFEPHVLSPYNTKACLPRWFLPPSETCFLPADAHGQVHLKFQEMITSLEARHGEIFWFDQNATYCDEEGCRLKFGDKLLFRDEWSHYSDYGSQMVVLEFSHWAREALPDLFVRR